MAKAGVHGEKPGLAPIGVWKKLGEMKSAVATPVRRGKPVAKKLRGVAKSRPMVGDPIDAVVGILKRNGLGTDEIVRELRGR